MNSQEGSEKPNVNIHEKVASLLQLLTVWRFVGEESRSILHELGTTLQSLRSQLVELRRTVQFPSFMDSGSEGAVEILPSGSERKRELIRLVYELAPSDPEILTWLGSREDKEAAYFYAYARGSVSDTSNPRRAAFYDQVEGIMAGDARMVQFAKTELMLRAAETRYADCQAIAYQPMD